MKAGLLRNGMVLDLNGKVVQVIEFEHLPDDRINVKAKNPLSGQREVLQFNANDELTEIRFESTTASYLYKEDGMYHFMDETSYDQVAVENTVIPEYFEYVAEGTDCILKLYKGRIYEVIPPRRSIIEVTGVKNGIATLETGAEIKVSRPVEAGNQIVIDTVLGEFLEVY